MTSAPQLITPDKPPRFGGWLHRGEGVDLAAIAHDGQPWPAAPVLRIADGPSYRLEQVDGDTARRSLTAAEVDAIIAIMDARRHYAVATLTLGDGETLRTRATGYLGLAEPGDGSDHATVGPIRILVGPAGPGATPEQVADLVADYLDDHPPIGSGPTGVTVDLLPADADPTADLVDGVLTLGIPAAPPGTDGTDGTDGQSAYQLAVTHGYAGDEASWLASIHGQPGRGITTVTADGTTATVTYTDTTTSTFALPTAPGVHLTADPDHPGLYLIGEPL